MDILPELVQNVHSQNVETQLAATTQFRKLLSREKNPPIEQVIACGVVPRFVQFLRSDHTLLQASVVHKHVSLPLDLTSCL